MKGEEEEEEASGSEHDEAAWRWRAEIHRTEKGAAYRYRGGCQDDCGGGGGDREA